MALTLHPPVTPRTPVDLFAALALTPYIAPAIPSTIPSLHIEPPSPIDSSISPASAKSTISLHDLIKHSALSNGGATHRELTVAEARHLVLLLHQDLGPVRASPKGLMRESIHLSEKLYDAGIQWDRHTRVMGLHLRGVWEDMQKIDRGVVTSASIESYVQRRFITVSEEPHPLETMPLPIAVQRPALAPLPKHTVEAGLASPFAPLSMVIPHSTALYGELGQIEVSPLPSHSMSAMPGCTKPLQNKRLGWKDKKKAGLRVRTDAKYKDRAIAVPCSAVSSKGIGGGALKTLRKLRARSMQLKRR